MVQMGMQNCYCELRIQNCEVRIFNAEFRIQNAVIVNYYQIQSSNIKLHVDQVPLSNSHQGQTPWQHSTHGKLKQDLNELIHLKIHLITLLKARRNTVTPNITIHTKAPLYYYL